MRRQGHPFLRPGPRGIDGLLAVGMALALQLELWLGETYAGAPAFPGPELVSAPLLLVAAGALAWRRTRPLTAFAVTAGAICLQSLLAGGSEAVGLFLLVLVSVYSAAAYATRLAPVIALAAVMLTVHAATDPFVRSAGDAVFATLFAAAGLVLGRALHGRGVRARRLAERARRVEAEADREAQLAVAHERTRIARELHDVVAHSVSVMVIQSQAAQAALSSGPSPARTALETIESTGREAMGEMRRLVGMLREQDHHGLQPQPGVAALGPLVAALAESGLTVHLSTDPGSTELTPGVELAVFRIVQEGLTNVLKHSAAREAEVRVERAAGGVVVTVEDPGPAAAAPAGAGAGHGLVGMRERVELYGGVLEAGPRSNGGFAVRAVLPAASAQAAGGRTANGTRPSGSSAQGVPR